jgi:hypothetical protein
VLHALPPVVIRIGRHVPFTRDDRAGFMTNSPWRLITDENTIVVGPAQINSCTILYVRCASPVAYCIDDLQSC